MVVNFHMNWRVVLKLYIWESNVRVSEVFAYVIFYVLVFSPNLSQIIVFVMLLALLHLVEML